MKDILKVLNDYIKDTLKDTGHFIMHKEIKDTPGIFKGVKCIKWSLYYNKDRKNTLILTKSINKYCDESNKDSVEREMNLEFIKDFLKAVEDHKIKDVLYD